MQVYHGTAANFPIKQLTYGPDSSAQLGKPMSGLWLSTNPKLAVAYASWSADCTGENHLRVISLEMNEDCPRWHNPDRPEDFVIRYPEPQYENGNLKVLRGYRLRRTRAPIEQKAWLINVKWDISDIPIAVPHLDMMEKLPYWTHGRQRCTSITGETGSRCQGASMSPATYQGTKGNYC